MPCRVARICLQEEAEKAFVQDQLVAEANWDEKMMRFTEALESQFTELNNRHAEQLELLR